MRYAINPDLAWRVIDGEIVILRIETTTYYSLNDVGAHVWRLMENQSRTRDELIEGVLQEYEVDRRTATSDVDELLSDLAGEKLLIPDAVP